MSLGPRLGIHSRTKPQACFLPGQVWSGRSCLVCRMSGMLAMPTENLWVTYLEPSPSPASSHAESPFRQGRSKEL